jgi:hypothetical protein
VWYLKDGDGANAYGSIEVSATPWVTNPWKKIKGSVEPSLSVHVVDMEVCHRDRAVGDETMLAGAAAARSLWLVLFSRPLASVNSLEYFSLLTDYTMACADVLLSEAIGK